MELQRQNAGTINSSDSYDNEDFVLPSMPYVREAVYGCLLVSFDGVCTSGDVGKFYPERTILTVSRFFLSALQFLTLGQSLTNAILLP